VFSDTNYVLAGAGAGVDDSPIGLRSPTNVNKSAMGNVPACCAGRVGFQSGLLAKKELLSASRSPTKASATIRLPTCPKCFSLALDLRLLEDVVPERRLDMQLMLRRHFSVRTFGDVR
jgi:hypothetical protein